MIYYISYTWNMFSTSIILISDNVIFDDNFIFMQAKFSWHTQKSKTYSVSIPKRFETTGISKLMVQSHMSEGNKLNTCRSLSCKEK